MSFFLSFNNLGLLTHQIEGTQLDFIWKTKTKIGFSFIKQIKLPVNKDLAVFIKKFSAWWETSCIANNISIDQINYHIDGRA